ncbi:hypothetical protein BRD17_04080 [Halobacteriales archaeon SW_7_68_16]|nr:MAG: hypothetical protein BRD17_04080 [Halobacteriales archaeon SW_7_68_16]
MPAIEAALGVLLVAGVLSLFVVGAPGAGVERADERAQLDAYAEDAATVLAGQAPRHGGTSRVAEVVASERSFERERGALRHRVDRVLPDNLLFRVRTTHGSVGYRKPAGVAVGTATVMTTAGRVRIEVWYV